jgi:hypothetical protein
MILKECTGDGGKGVDCFAGANSWAWKSSSNFADAGVGSVWVDPLALVRIRSYSVDRQL